MSTRTLNKELADYYEATYLTPPQYIDDRKVSGLRDNVNARLLLKVLKESFGTKKLKAITHSDY